MSGLGRIVFFLIALYFLVRFVGIPLINLIANIVKLARLKKQVAKFGREIIPVEREANIKISFILIYAIFAILLIVIGIIVKNDLLYFGFCIFLPRISELILTRKITKFNGIYENGIVFGFFLEWKDVFSWKKIDENKISILKQDGLRFDLETKEKTNSAIEYFVQKGIAEEDSV